MHLTADGKRTTTRLTAGRVDLENAASVPVQPRLSRLVADRLEPQVSAKGHLAFRLTQQGTAARHGRAVVDRNLQGPAARTVKGSYRMLRAVRRDLASGARKVQVYHRMLRLLPVRKGTVVFESHLGRQYSDSPRAVHEELRRRRLPVTAIWSYSGARPEGFPEAPNSSAGGPGAT